MQDWFGEMLMHLPDQTTVLTLNSIASQFSQQLPDAGLQ